MSFLSHFFPHLSQRQMAVFWDALSHYKIIKYMERLPVGSVVVERIVVVSVVVVAVVVLAVDSNKVVNLNI